MEWPLFRQFHDAVTYVLTPQTDNSKMVDNDKDNGQPLGICKRRQNAVIYDSKHYKL